jgi:hypothetical protein
LTTPKVSLALSPGYQYCFQSQAVDKAGNASAWSPLMCTTRPLDDRSMTAGGGWTRPSASGFYLGTYSTSKTANAQLSRSGAAYSRVALVATRCPGCGTVGIYSGTTLLKSVSLASATTQRQWVYALPKSALRKGTLSVRVLSSGKPVQVDGVGISYYG